MSKAKLLVDEKYSFQNGRYFAHVIVYEISANKKFPEGVKVRCVLVDAESDQPRLLLDNHAPFGFHLHTRLPDDKDFRVSLTVTTAAEAIKYFMSQVKKVVKNEE